MRRVRINPVSEKRRAKQRERQKVIARMQRFGRPACQVRWEGICTGLADDAHELRSRARGGSITDPENIVPVCRPCHDHLTTHPKEATERGWMR